MRPDEALALMICAALATACSSESRYTKPVVVSPSPTDPSTATATGAAAVAGTATAADAPPTSTAVDPALIKEGYRAVRRQGTILYCQTQTVTGTKFANTVCKTAQQIQELKRETEQSRRLLIRSGPASCVGNQCSN
jgi:hypothetical protein